MRSRANPRASALPGGDALTCPPLTCPPARALAHKGDPSGALVARSEAWALAYVPLPSVEPPAAA